MVRGVTASDNTGFRVFESALCMAFQLSPEEAMSSNDERGELQQAACNCTERREFESWPAFSSQFLQCEEKNNTNIFNVFSLSLFYYFAKKSIRKFDFFCLVVRNAAGAKLYSS